MNNRIENLYNTIKDNTNGIFIDCGFFRGEVTSQLIMKLPDWKFYAFEINDQECNQYVLNLKDRYINFHYFNKAVYTQESTVRWYKDLRPNLPNGSNIIGKGHGLSKLDMETFYEVESIDLSNWIETNFNKNDYIVLKLDIEGAEYEVLERLISTNIISYINVLCVEWHPTLNYKKINVNTNNLPIKTINWL